MRHFRQAMENVRPTITDDLMDYYDQVEEQFKGSQAPDTGRRGSEHIGFQ
jgi:transitional endoplasmic reticulum ATPase